MCCASVMLCFSRRAANRSKAPATDDECRNWQQSLVQSGVSILRTRCAFRFTVIDCDSHRRDTINRSRGGSACVGTLKTFTNAIRSEHRER